MWRPLDEFPQYSISDDGYVKHNKKGTVLTHSKDGRDTVQLYKGSHKSTRSVSKLLRITFPAKFK